MKYSHLAVCVDVDADVEAGGGDRLVVRTADRVFEVEGKGLSRLFAEVLPRLLRSGGDVGLLTADDAALLEENVEGLCEMRVVVPVSAELGAELLTPDGAQLFTYFARRTERAEASYFELKRQALVVSGHELLARRLHGLLEPWFPSATLQGSSAPPPQLAATARVLVTATREQLAGARAAGRALCQRGVPWAPVVFDDEEVTIGPWCEPGRSACLECAFALRNEPPVGDIARAAATSATLNAWRSTRAHAGAWLAGVLATQLEALACPTSDASPWGRVTTLSLRDVTQRSEQVWRVPWCPSCGRPDVLPQRWLC